MSEVEVGCQGKILKKFHFWVKKPEGGFDDFWNFSARIWVQRKFQIFIFTIFGDHHILHLLPQQLTIIISPRSSVYDW